MQRTGESGDARSSAPRPFGWFTYLVMAMGAVGLVAPVAVYAYRHEVAVQRELVAQVATLKGDGLATWFQERRASAGLSGTSFPQAELYLAWRRDGDAAARGRLLLRLEQFADAGGFSGVALLDPTGRVLWASGTHSSLTGEVHPAWGADARSDAVAQVRTYRDDLDALHLDFFVPLPVDAEAGRPYVVYHGSLNDLLSPQLGDWVAPTRSGRVVVVYLDDGEVSVFGRQSSDDGVIVSQTVVPLEQSDVVAVRVALEATNDAPYVLEGRDRDGVRVIAAGREAGETGWVVAARIDRSEVLAGVVPTAVAAVLAAVVLYLGAVFWLGHLRRQQVAAVARGAEMAESERERAARLLAAVADASPDTIFAKDLEGHYTLVNRAGAEVVGRPIGEILGRTDGELFSQADAEVIRTKDREIMEQKRVVTFEEHVPTASGPRVLFTTKGPLVDRRDGVVGVFGISRDITERRAAEQTVADQAATLRAAVADLERFNRVLVDRELAMVALKRRVNAYAVRLGEAPPFMGEAIAASGNDDG